MLYSQAMLFPPILYQEEEEEDQDHQYIGYKQLYYHLFFSIYLSYHCVHNDGRSVHRLRGKRRRNHSSLASH